MGIMGTDQSNTVFIGDQLFTDVWGAKRSGIHNILVKPIYPKEEIQIVLKRYLEKVVLHFYKKSRDHGGSRLLWAACEKENSVSRTKKGWNVAESIIELEKIKEWTNVTKGTVRRIYRMADAYIEKGTTYEIDGKVYECLDFLHVKPGEGCAFVGTK